MERNLANELDLLKDEIEAIKKAIEVPISRAVFAKEKFNKLREEMEDHCKKQGHIGEISHYGYFDARTNDGGETSTWTYHKNANELLALIENRTAEKVLACIGNHDRLNILLALLKQPNTVAGIVESCKYSSPGQVYHHLRPLIAADLISERENKKGEYCVRPHRVPDIIALLAAIDGLTSTRFTTGDWDEANNKLAPEH